MSRCRPVTFVAVMILALGIGFLGCELDTQEPPVRTEQTYQGTYMGSVGNSLTAGFMSGGLEKAGQIASFPNHLSKVILGREMQMPIVDTPGLGSESGMTPLFINESGDLTREPLTVNPLDLLLNLTYPAPYDNLGIPGATTHQILTTLFADEVGNPMFDLILRNAALPSGGTAIEELERLSPDIITAWAGNNEILGGALSGSPQSDDPQAPGYVVPLADYQQDFRALCDRIAALQPKMVAIANIPPITDIPYTRFFGTGSIPGINRWIMEEDLDDDGDPVQLVLLHAPISDCPGCFLPSCQFDPATPCDTIPANATLTVAETELVTNAIADYNAFLAAEVASRGWALVDIHEAFLALPRSPNVQELNVAFAWQVDPLSGIGEQNHFSAFTLDGIHPSEKGHAHVANLFLQAFNETYETSYPLIDEEAVVNVSGFERAPVAAKSDNGINITQEGRRGLRVMVEMMQGR